MNPSDRLVDEMSLLHDQCRERSDLLPFGNSVKRKAAAGDGRGRWDNPLEISYPRRRNVINSNH